MPQHDERRQEARAPIELKVEYKRLNTFFYDYTKNISKGGTFIKTKRPLPVGTMFLFKLFIPALSDPLVVRGEVRWTRKEGEGDAAAERAGGDDGDADPGMGIRLLYDDDDQRRKLEGAVEKLMLESLGPLIYSHLRSEDEPEE
jgi:type IV pilus assembly protein PilZ